MGPGEIKSWVIQNTRKNAVSRTRTTTKDEDDLVAALPLCVPQKCFALLKLGRRNLCVRE